MTEISYRFPLREFDLPELGFPNTAGKGADHIEGLGAVKEGQA